MSTPTRSRTVEGVDLSTLLSLRTWALASAGVLTLTYMSVLYHVVDVVGGVSGLWLFAFEVVVALALAVALSTVVKEPGAVMLGTALFALGLLVYVLIAPGSTVDLARQAGDTIALLTGLSVLRMVKAGVWALGFLPGPLFVSWYFFLRRRYALGTVVAGAALAFFISTGDLDTVAGLIGVLGAVGTLAFGRLDREGGTAPQRNTVLALVVVMLVVTTSVSIVPGGEAQPLLPGHSTATVEGSLLSAGDRVDVLGSISLSPKVRFTVTSDEPRYWRVGAYDRYTGDGWVRTGSTQDYGGPLSRPEGDATRLEQQFRVESRVDTMPAAWKPYRVGLGKDKTRVTSMGGLQPDGTLSEGERYDVVSYVSDPSPDDLREAGTSYPGAIRERYLQLPESTPRRVGQFTAELTANADNPYDTAVIVERWLLENKAYSLEVNRPDGDIASAFLFEMEAGYCVYYATAMVAMLRSQDIPARFVVGYTPGQRTSEDTWVVRGYNSHAWVEVYFPDHGWVAFDPTPASNRQASETARLQQARAANEENVDTDDSRSSDAQGIDSALDPQNAGGDTPFDSRDVAGTGQGETNATETRGELALIGPADEPSSADTDPPGGGATGGGGDGDGLPSRETVLYGLILLAGGVTAIHRTGLLGRGYREVWLRRAPDGTPTERVEGAFARVEYLLARRHRPRRPDETAREYVGSLDGQLDERALRVYALYERARYAGRATAEEAETAGRLVRELVAERSTWR